MAIIQLLLAEIYYLHRQIAWLMSFIAQYIPLKQFSFDDSKSPKYQKFKTDILPKFQYHQDSWTWEGLIDYYRQRYGKVINPVPALECVPRMPDKWQQLIMLGQKKIIQLQNETTA